VRDASRVPEVLPEVLPEVESHKNKFSLSIVITE